jgi:phage terminase large subunit-like protein
MTCSAYGLDDAKNSKDPKIVSHVYCADKDASVLDEKAWKAANPALNTFRSLEDIIEQAKQAARMPSAENTFRNLCSKPTHIYSLTVYF